MKTLDVHPVVIDGELLDSVASLAELAQLDGRGFFQDADYLYVKTPDGSPPTEAGLVRKWKGYGTDWQERDLFYKYLILIQANDVTLSGLTVRYAGGYAVYSERCHYADKTCDELQSITIENCNVGYSTINGVLFKSVIGGVLSESEVHHNVLQNWPRDEVDNWAMGVAYYSGRDGQIIGNAVHSNNGEGIGTLGLRWPEYHGSIGLEIRNNVVYDNWGINVWLDHAADAIVDSNFIYVSGELEQPTQRRSIPSCVSGAEEGDFGQPGDLHNVIVSNNIGVGCRRGFSYWYDSSAPPGAGLVNFTVANNTFVNIVDSAITIYDWGRNAQHSGSVFRNNIVYGAGGRMVSFPSAGANDTIFSNNLWYDGGGFYWKDTGYDFDEWVELPNVGDDSMWAYPELVSGGAFIPESYRIISSSPAIDTGIALRQVATDYWGTSRPAGDDYDIGAHECTHLRSNK